MLSFIVRRAWEEILSGNFFVIIENISMKLGHHSKVVNVYRVLVDVLKNTELAILKRKFNSVFEILICIYYSPLLVFTFNCFSVYDSQGQFYESLLALGVGGLLFLVELIQYFDITKHSY